MLALAGCTTGDIHTASDALPLNATEGAIQLAEVKDNIDTLDAKMLAPAHGLAADAGATAHSATSMSFVDDTPPLRAIGYAQIAGQPGKTANEKRLMALKAARMEALRDLTEQVHGIRLNAETTVHDVVVRSDSLHATVSGTLRGARTVRITPTGSDSYEVEMVIDRGTLAYLVRALRGQM